MKEKEIFASLNVVLDIFKKLDTQPFFMGSLIGASINSRFYREIGDVDVIADIQHKKSITGYLENHGFKSYVNKNIGFISILGCCPTEFSDGIHKFSFIFGNYREDYFELPLKYGFSFRWPKEELRYRYELGNRKFLGFSPEFYFLFLVVAAKKKGKRKKDIEVVFKKFNRNKLLEIVKQDFIYWHNKPVPVISKLQYLKIKFKLQICQKKI